MSSTSSIQDQVKEKYGGAARAVAQSGSLQACCDPGLRCCDPMTTNLYGADEYIEEQIPEKEFKQIIRKLFPELGPTVDMPVESREFDEARRLARLILSDIIIYHAAKVERGIRDNNFFELLRDEIAEGRQYYESRVPKRVLRDSEIFTETLQQFVQMKREEMQRLDTGTNGS